MELRDKESIKKSIEQFKLGPKIGEGAYGRVLVAIENGKKEVVAIKIMEKALILKLKKQNSVFRERDVMNKLKNHPFFVNIHCSFQDKAHLYFVISYARRGEMLRYITYLNGFDEDTTRFYSSEIVCALEYLHGLGIVHRDLKPENILLKENYHIMITDFGTAKILEAEKTKEADNVAIHRQSSFVGTAQYVSPELLMNKYICTSSDLWALGVVIYQMVTCSWMFSASFILFYIKYLIRTEYLIFQKIRNLLYSFPESFPLKCKDLVENLIKLDPKVRLGNLHNGGYPALKAHPFFEGVSWDNILNAIPPEQITQANVELLPTVSLESLN